MPRFSSTNRRNRSAAEIRELLSHFHSSTVSLAEFVQTEGISLATLRRYLASKSPFHKQAESHTNALPFCRVIRRMKAFPAPR
jgi:hypothetical protein